MTEPRVVVVGAGITGLACAVTLLDQASRERRPLSLTVLEAGPAPGGHAQTVVADGFVVEAGPNGFLSREPETLALVEALGLGTRLVEARPEAKRRFIVRGGTLRPVPDGPLGLLTSSALTWRGTLRLLAEPFAAGPPPGTDESVHAFATRRLGEEAADMLVDAAVSGISAGDSRQLSLRAQFPVLSEMEAAHGSLLKAMLARPRAPGGPARLLSFEGGMATLVHTLAGRLGRRLRCGAPVRTLARDRAGWRLTTADGEQLDADHVVCATPARAAADMLDATDPALAAGAGGTASAGLAVVALAYRTRQIPRPLDGYGYLTTRGEGLATLGVVWESSLFPGRAPEGWALLRVMLGGVRRPDVVTMGGEATLALARRELAQVLGVTAPPAHSWVFTWPSAIAQYTTGHLERRAAMSARVAMHDGLSLCGTSYDGVSFNHAVKSGCVAARAVAGRLWGEAPGDGATTGDGR